VFTALSLVLCVTAVWWCSTGAILLLVRRPRHGRAAVLAVATVVLCAAALALHWSSRLTTIGGSCLAFAAAVLVWGWIELSFLLGAITGPRVAGCEPACSGWRHLRHAIEAILYHELVTIAAALLVTALTWRAPNATGLWTFMILWGMRISAKLNLFLGVPNTGEAMLPPHLRYLGGYFRRRALNALLPVSLGGAALLCALLGNAAWEAPAWDYRAAGLTLLATLSGLGLIEHLMLLLPMPADAPWKALRTAPVLHTKPGPAT